METSPHRSHFIVRVEDVDFTVSVSFMGFFAHTSILCSCVILPDSNEPREVCIVISYSILYKGIDLSV
jgi:hypothetical protein